MAHCTKCGADLPDTAQFCQKCGQPQAAPQPGTGFRPATPPYQPAASGLSENVAATLSYVLGWLTGIIFYLIDKRPYVRFHAAQSIVTFGGLSIIRRLVAIIFGLGWAFGGFSPFGGYGNFAGFGIGVMLGNPDRAADVCALDRVHDQGVSGRALHGSHRRRHRRQPGGALNKFRSGCRPAACPGACPEPAAAGWVDARYKAESRRDGK